MTSKPLDVSIPRQDVLASFAVFLVAIPLSLGIAVASGAPLAAGLIAALVGVVFLGLGEGVLAGIAVTGLLALRRLTRLTIRVEHLVPRPGDRPGPVRTHVVVEGTLTFLGVPTLTRHLQDVPPGARVDLDLNVDFMDHAASTPSTSGGSRTSAKEAGPTSTRFTRLGMKER